MKGLHTIDDILYNISKQYDILKLLDPKDVTERRNPVYHYNSLGFDIEASREILHSLKIDKTGLLGRLFEERRQEILNTLDLIESTGKDAEKFTQASINLYGKPSEHLVKEAYDILRKVRRDAEEQRTIPPEKVKTELENLLKSKDYHGWNVEIDGNMVAGMKVSPKHSLISIKNEPVSETKLERYKAHEILTHVRRAVAAKKQPYKLFLHLPGYELTEEGLAIVAEKQAGVLSNSTLRNCAGNVIAVHLSLDHSYDEVFQELSKYFPENEAKKRVKRAKRGLKDTSQKGAFTKDYHYLQGMYDVEDYLAKGGDKDILYTAKIGLQHVPTVRKLIEKGIINDLEE